MEPRHTSETALIPIGKAATELGISVDTLRRWAAAGRIEAVRLPTGHRRFRVADIEALKQASA